MTQGSFAVKGILLGAALLGAAIAGQAQNFNFDKAGKLQVEVGGTPFIDGESLLLMDAGYKPIVSPTSAKPSLSTSPTGVSLAEWSDKGGTLSRQVTQEKDGAILVRYEFAFQKGIAGGKNIELCLSIPRAALDSLPASGGMKDVKVLGAAIDLDTLGGKVHLDSSGSSSEFALQDLRDVNWSGKFRLKLYAPYSPETGAKGVASLLIKAQAAANSAFCPLPLESPATRPFVDNAKGEGWTGQGGTNDLRCLSPGLLVLSGIPFDISGRAILLKGSHTDSFPASSGRLPFKEPVSCEALYVLHNTAWSGEFDVPVASYRLLYADNSSATVPVKYGRDINDWWMARQPVDAKLGWSGSNGSAELGLSLLRIANPHPEKPLAAIEFVSAETAATPILVAATALKVGALTNSQTEALAAAFAKRPKPVVDTGNWFECPIAWCGPIQEGSAIDFSFFNHKPAGKFGFVRSKDGHFEFEKTAGSPVRFWGSNFAIQGPFPEKEFAPGIAKCIAMQGANLVRLHLYASSCKLLVGEDGAIKKDMLDKMEFLISELEKNGVYIFMDLNDGLPYEALLGKPEPKDAKLKMASIFDPELRKATKKLASELFTHVNPYTGKALVDDPGVAMFEIINESSMLIDWGSLESAVPEPYLTELKGLWSGWLKRQGLADRPLPASFKVDADARRFATEYQTQYLQDMAAHLRSLGVKVPVSGTNITFALGDLKASVASKMDYLGEHSYFDHPGVSSRPMTYNDNKALERPVFQLPLIADLAKGALKGYPLVNGEWNFCFPNDYRCEGIPYTAAYASYQDWAGMIFYCATGSFDSGNWSRFPNNPGILIHSQQTDPSTWGLSQVGAAMYRRGDVETAKRQLEAILPDSAIDENLMAIKKMPFLPALGRYHLSFSGPEGKANWIGELAQSQLGAKELYQEVLNKIGDKDSDQDKVISDTRQLRRHVNPALLFVDTPKTQSVNGRLCDIQKSGDALSGLKVESPMLWGSINLVSIDGKDIASSGRMLLVAVGNSRNKSSKCDASSGLIHDMGKGPVIAEPAEARLTLAKAPPKAKVFALDTLTGARRGELKTSFSGSSLSFELGADDKTICYEIVSE